MSSLQKKIDFAAILLVDHANPNGDPLNGNRPRTDYDGYGEISDVCLKRKVRDRLLENGQSVFVQSDDRKIDGMKSLRERAESDVYGLGKDAFQFKKAGKKGSKTKDVSEENENNEEQLKKKEKTARDACAKWYDVRAFGQLFAFKDKDKDSKKNKKDVGDDADDDDTSKSDASSGVSIPVRGPVSIQSAYSVEPLSITSIQITKSTSAEGDGVTRGSDTMGMKHRVDRGIYVFYGSMNPQLAERTGFSDEDAEVIKGILSRLFENDASSARPDGSMAMLTVFWWKHSCKAGQYSSAKVHRSLKVRDDGSYELDASATPGLQAEIIPGF
jgi:CRISPR-associated protein Csd2